VRHHDRVAAADLGADVDLAPRPGAVDALVAEAAAGAIVAGRLACADAMPTQAEVEAKLEESVNA
jgi:hypothetical protein